MSDPLVESRDPVTLIGGGTLESAQLCLALGAAPRLVAADGGAARALALGHVPEAVIGDFDSVDAATCARLDPARLHRIPEQETTDFDKALRSIRAPFVLALGFVGSRLDHTLGAFNTLARHRDRRCLLLSGEDICFLAPRALDLALPVGTRVSLFPVGPVSGRSTGLRWPIDGIDFAPDSITGTSNEVTGELVSLRFAARAMLVILPQDVLAPALDGLASAPG